jgi:hypothetical protein
MSTCLCGHPLWSSKSIERGYCEHCRLLGDWRHSIAGLRTLPYRWPARYVSPWGYTGDEDLSVAPLCVTKSYNAYGG